MVKAKNTKNKAQLSDGEPPHLAERHRRRADPKADNSLHDSKHGAKRRNKAGAHAGEKVASNKAPRKRKPTSEFSKKGLRAPNPEAQAALSDICQSSPEQEPLIAPFRQSLSKVDKVSAFAAQSQERQHLASVALSSKVLQERNLLLEKGAF